VSEEKVFRLPTRYADRDSLTQVEKDMLEYYVSFADENGIKITYDKELDVALVTYNSKNLEV